MKRMKKGLALLTAAALTAGLLTGCGGMPAGRPEPGPESVRGYLEKSAGPDRVGLKRRGPAGEFLEDGYYRAGRDGMVRGGAEDMGRDMGEKAKDILKDAGKGAKRVGRATGRAAHEIGRAARKAGRDVVDEMKKP